MVEPRAKKTSLACASCRRRKRKCDGKTPVCSSCEKNDQACGYDEMIDQRRPAQKSYVVALEARVALLENILKNAGVGDAVGILELTTITEHQPGPRNTPTAVPTPTLAPTVSTPAEVEPNDQSDDLETGFVPSDDAANALESISLVNPEEGKVLDSSHALDLGMGGYVPLVSLEAEHKMLAQFWDWQRMHMPYVAPAPFLSAYAIHSEATHPNEPIPSPPPPPNSLAGPSAIDVPRAASVELTTDLVQFISPLLLDSMFAIAALFHGDPETSERFYRRAETRVIHESASPRLATVQAMLIMATWELGHARAPANWTLIGVACALCVRLGMNIDATPLLRRGAMSKRLFETRNFVFWASYNMDRFSAMCMGMHPLMDRRMVETPRHSSLAAANVTEAVKPTASGGSSACTKPVAGAPKEKPIASDTNIYWWNPVALGMGDVIIQAGWEATRDLVRMSEILFDGIYSFNVPRRTPQEDLEIVTRNNLTVQRFLDELPTWLRSTGAIRRKENGLVYLHLFTHLTSIIASRPFLSHRPLSEEAMRIDATTDPTQPTHSSHTIRRYRTLAFRVARASALQITSLIRHIPLSSPCVTLPYVIYSACTILLLAPDEQAAMDGVRTSVSVLESMDESGYWATSAKDGKDRIQALAKRWGVALGPGKKALGRVSSRGAGPCAGGSDADGSGAGGSNTGGRSASEGCNPGGSRGTSTNPVLSAPNAIGGTRSSAVGRDNNSQDTTEPLSGIARSQPGNYPNPASSQTQEYTDESGQTHTNQSNSHYSNKVGLDQTGAGLPSYGDVVTSQDYGPPIGTQSYNLQGFTRHSGVSTLASAGQTEAYTHQQPEYTPQYAQQPPYPSQQQPVQHIHYHFYVCPLQHPHQSQYASPQDLYQPPQRLPHVAHGHSHADPQHDLQLPHTHWHQVLPPADPNLPFPPDPIACTDMAACFADTVRTGQDPTFVQTMTDPYASVAIDWFSDAQNSFAVITPEMYGEGIDPILSFGRSTLDTGGPGMYAQGTQTGGSSWDQYAGPSEDYGGGYGVPVV